MFDSHNPLTVSGINNSSPSSQKGNPPINSNSKLNSDVPCEVALVFIAGGSNSHLANMRAQRDNCFVNLPRNIRCLWLIADENIDSPVYADSVLYLPVSDVYENLLGKSVLGIDWVLENWDPKLIIRSNTSNFFNLLALDSLLDTVSSIKNLYGGVIGSTQVEFEGSSRSVSYISGAGIYLDSSMARKLIEIDVEKYLPVVEDIAIGMYFEDLGYAMTSISRNDVTDWHPLTFSFQSRIKAWHSDQITLRRFKEIGKISNSKSQVRIMRYALFQIRESIRAAIAGKPLNSIRLVKSLPTATASYVKLSNLSSSKYSVGVPQSK